MPGGERGRPLPPGIPEGYVLDILLEPRQLSCPWLQVQRRRPPRSSLRTCAAQLQLGEVEAGQRGRHQHGSIIDMADSATTRARARGARGGEIALTIGLIGPRGAFWLCLRASMGPSAIRIETKTLSTNTNGYPAWASDRDRQTRSIRRELCTGVSDTHATVVGDAASERERFCSTSPCSLRSLHPQGAQPSLEQQVQTRLVPGPTPPQPHARECTHTVRCTHRPVSRQISGRRAGRCVARALRSACRR